MYALTSGPKWIDFAPAGIPGVSVLFAPPSPSAKRKAQRASAAVLREAGIAPDPATGKLPDDLDVDVMDAAMEAYAAELIRAGIRDWKGLGEETDDGAEGAPIAVTPEAIERFLQDEPLFSAADDLYVGAIAARQAEKNGFSGSPNGTSAARTPAKRTAATARPAAKPARTSKTNPKPRTAKTPGK